MLRNAEQISLPTTDAPRTDSVGSFLRTVEIPDELRIVQCLNVVQGSGVVTRSNV